MRAILRYLYMYESSRVKILGSFVPHVDMYACSSSLVTVKFSVTKHQNILITKQNKKKKKEK